MKSPWTGTLALACTLLITPSARADNAASYKQNTTADHSKFKELQQPFASGP